MMLPEMCSNFTMVIPTMSVMLPALVAVRIGSEHTILPVSVMIVPDAVTMTSAVASAKKKDKGERQHTANVARITPEHLFKGELAAKACGQNLLRKCLYMLYMTKIGIM